MNFEVKNKYSPVIKVAPQTPPAQPRNTERLFSYFGWITIAKETLLIVVRISRAYYCKKKTLKSTGKVKKVTILYTSKKSSNPRMSMFL